MGERSAKTAPVPLLAVILAAGRGVRLGALTASTHKGLITLHGCSLLSRLVRGLSAAGVRDVLLVTGYCGDDVTAHLRAAHPEVRIARVHNDDYATTNNIVSLARALPHVSGREMLLAECDVVLDDALLTALVHGPGDVALVDAHVAGQLGTVVSVSGDAITRVLPGAPAGEPCYKTVNLYRLSAAFTSALAPRLEAAARARPGAYYETVFGDMVADGIAMRALVASPHRWIEIDTDADLRAAERLFAGPDLVSAGPAPI